MLINKISYSNETKYNPNFNGLTRQLNKRVFIDGQLNIKPIVDAHRERGQSLIVGQLPKFIMNKLPKDNLKPAIMEIYNTFDEVCNELRSFDENDATNKYAERAYMRKNSTVEKLKAVFQKYKIIYPWDDFDLKYVGKGGKGKTYKLEGIRDNTNLDEDELIMKVFHLIEGDNWHYYKSHGCYSEINSAAYWMNNVGWDTSRGKFFWASLGSGYMINKFIDEDVRLPKRTEEQYNYGLKVTDEDAKTGQNVCKGYSYDWGGVRVVNRVKNENKIARAIYRKFERMPDKHRLIEWWTMFNRQNKANQESINAGLAMSIKYMKNKEECIESCMKLHQPEVDRALAYVLKYLPYRDAVKYYRKLVKTDDAITQIILFNEMPLLAMKHRDEEIKDDLQTTRSEILPKRLEVYYHISEKNALPESVEHLASFVHLLPREDMLMYYRRLQEIAKNNPALRERMEYKRSSLPPDLFQQVKSSEGDK